MVLLAFISLRYEVNTEFWQWCGSYGKYSHGVSVLNIMEALRIKDALPDHAKRSWIDRVMIVSKLGLGPVYFFFRDSTIFQRNQSQIMSGLMILVCTLICFNVTCISEVINNPTVTKSVTFQVATTQDSQPMALTRGFEYSYYIL